MEKMMLGIWGVVLVIQTIYDLKWRRIPIGVTILGSIVGMIGCIVQKREWVEIVWALIPGMSCLIYSKITKEALGYGDGLLLCGMGFFFPIEDVLFICMVAFGMAGIAALICVVFFHKGKTYEMPFVPFIMTACLIDIGIKAGGGW